MPTIFFIFGPMRAGGSGNPMRAGDPGLSGAKQFTSSKNARFACVF